MKKLEHNPFLGFGRGGYFSTSRTYKLAGEGRGRSASKISKHKGYAIYQSAEGEFEVPELDRASRFESVKDAKRFIDYWVKRNPGMAKSKLPSNYEVWRDYHGQWILSGPDIYLGLGYGSKKEAMVKAIAALKRHGVISNLGHTLIIKNPASWFTACVKGVQAKGGAVDPRKVCGSVLKRKRALGNPYSIIDFKGGKGGKAIARGLNADSVRKRLAKRRDISTLMVWEPNKQTYPGLDAQSWLSYNDYLKGK